MSRFQCARFAKRSSRYIASFCLARLSGGATVEVEGVPAHSSKPHLGVNAITGMAKVILALDKINETLSQRVHPLVSRPTLTITLIEGGTELATVPPSCRVWIDRRLIPRERPADALQEVENILEGLRQGPDKINVRSLLPALEDPAPPSAEATKIAAVAAKACAEVAGTGQHRGVPYGTDASQLSLGGIPCVILGLGASIRLIPPASMSKLTS
ncbi:peptidase dimerization domain-containing protein [Mesorhizobium sp.]|uniref:peptidase dimerization domain-containing protein n=3 Tax=Mesorhizobium sp. TaxID=1871066 RepID=UPI00342BAE5E